MAEPKLRVWHIPQVPGKPFHVDVASVEEAVKIMDVLANYDAFQFDNKIKPDYCNAQCLMMLENGEWTEWYHEEKNGDYYDDPKDFINSKYEMFPEPETY